jgi:hypothetical protein
MPPWPLIDITTPMQRLFDLSRSVDLHTAATTQAAMASAGSSS